MTKTKKEKLYFVVCADDINFGNVYYHQCLAIDEDEAIENAKTTVFIMFDSDVRRTKDFEYKAIEADEKLIKEYILIWMEK